MTLKKKRNATRDTYVGTLVVKTAASYGLGDRRLRVSRALQQSPHSKVHPHQLDRKRKRLCVPYPVVRYRRGGRRRDTVTKKPWRSGYIQFPLLPAHVHRVTVSKTRHLSGSFGRVDSLFLGTSIY